MGPSKCPVCEGPMKPLFQSFYCPDEDKPDHGKLTMQQVGQKYSRGAINLDEFVELWKKIISPVVN